MKEKLFEQTNFGARNALTGTMGLLSFIFLLVLYLLQGSNTSLVQLNNNGYEGIIFAIDPRVPEDGKIIEQIKVRKKWDFFYLNCGEEKKLVVNNYELLNVTGSLKAAWYSKNNAGTAEGIGSSRWGSTLSHHKTRDKAQSLSDLSFFIYK